MVDALEVSLLVEVVPVEAVLVEVVPMNVSLDEQLITRAKPATPTAPLGLLVRRTAPKRSLDIALL